MSEKKMEERFDDFFSGAIAANPVFPYQAKVQMAKLIEETLRSDGNITKILERGGISASRGGFIAEEHAATTFNMDAILKDNSARAETGLDRNLISNNDSVSDIVISPDGKTVSQSIQSKYNVTAESTAKAHSTVNKDLSIKYETADVALSPSDHVDKIRSHALSRADHHDQQAAIIARDGGNSQLVDAHKAQAEAYRQTARKVSATIDHEDVSSRPLTKAEADEMGGGDLSKLDEIRSEYKTTSTVQQMGKAAVAAGAMAAVITGTVNTVRYLSLARQGKLSTEQAVVKIVSETAASAADSAIKASAVTGMHSLITRATGEALIAPLAKQGLGVMLRSNAVTVAGICAVDAVKDLVLLAKGEITKDMFYERQGKGILNTSAGVMGGSLGAAAFSAMGGATLLLPIVGGLAGGLIAGCAMKLAIENGIEAPYRELSVNTVLMQDAARILDKVSGEIFQGQVMFEKFLQADGCLDRAFSDQMKSAAVSTAAMRSAIDRI